MIQQNELIECGWCKKESTAEEWQETTRTQLYTREQRRAFKKVEDEKIFKKGSKIYYLCPKCGLWIQGCQMKMTREEDGKTKTYGGQPIMKIVKNRANLG